MRLRNDPLANEFVKNSSFTVDKFPIKLNKNTIIEIGMGKGEMLTEMAFQNTHKTFIGIEKYPTVVAKAIKRAQKYELKNFFVVNQDISELKNSFDGKVKEIWLTFSDPWPKKRHFKRRLTYKTFLEIYKIILDDDGVLKIKTDNDAFFEWSIESLKEFGANIVYLTRDLHNDKKNESNIYTGYELKWKEKKINYMEVKF